MQLGRPLTLARFYSEFRRPCCGRGVAHLQRRVDECAAIAQDLKPGVLEVPQVIVTANIERGSETREREAVQPVYLEELTDDGAPELRCQTHFPKESTPQRRDVRQ